jgi:hypothetical protein
VAVPSGHSDPLLDAAGAPPQPAPRRRQPAARKPLASLFSDVTAVHHQQASPAVIADQVAAADLVVLEVVERAVVGGKTSVLGTRTLDAIQSALDRHPRSASTVSHP